MGSVCLFVCLSICFFMRSFVFTLSHFFIFFTLCRTFLSQFIQSNFFVFFTLCRTFCIVILFLFIQSSFSCYLTLSNFTSCIIFFVHNVHFIIRTWILFATKVTNSIFAFST